VAEFFTPFHLEYLSLQRAKHLSALCDVLISGILFTVIIEENTIMMIPVTVSAQVPVTVSAQVPVTVPAQVPVKSIRIGDKDWILQI
jgi:hypothetical protein